MTFWLGLLLEDKVLCTWEWPLRGVFEVHRIPSRLCFIVVLVATPGPREDSDVPAEAVCQRSTSSAATQTHGSDAST